MFTRKFTVIVLVSLISVLSLMDAGCSDPFSYSGIHPSDHESYEARLSREWLDSQLFGSGTNRLESPSIIPRRGIVSTPEMGQLTTAARQPDGKIVAAGGSGLSFIKLVRYQSNGNLDSTFGDGGIVTTAFFDDYMTAVNYQGIAAIVIQPDGKILCAGTVLHNYQVHADYNRYDFGLARYNTDGSLDTTFGTGGKVITDIFPNRADVATSLALQPDGKIVAAGFSGAYETPVVASDFVIVRYNTDGSLDSTFGTGGKVITDIGNDSDFASSLAIQPDGKMVVGGFAYTLTSHSYDFALARYSSSGNLDSSFGSGGKVLIDLSNSVPNDPGDEIMTSMVLQPDGKILCVGTGEPYRHTTATDFLIARFNPNGSLDTTFGTGGKVTTDFNGSIDEGFSIALQPDGKFAVAGVANGDIDGTLIPALFISGRTYTAQSPTLSDFAVARYNPDGSLDQSFGTGGKTETDIFGERDAAVKVLIMPNGNILALGLSNTGNPFAPFAGTSVMYQGTVLQRRKLNDFDGDGRAEFAVFRQSNGTWYIQNSNTNSLRPAFRAVQFGASGDKPVAGDYDGDGRADIAVYRNGFWYILQSSNNSFRAVQFGDVNDKPVQDDYDGDGKTDIAVYRPSNGTWYLLRSKLGFTGVQFGVGSDIPVNGDYDGDGKSDVAVYRPSNGVWYRLNSSNGAFNGAQFGAAEDKPVVGDYDGDGIYDLAVFRPSNGTWYVLKSTEGFSAAQFGISSDIPVPADYDGDGRTDFAVFRPSNGNWYFLRSSDGSFSGTQFGANGDVPVPAIP